MNHMPRPIAGPLALAAVLLSGCDHEGSDPQQPRQPDARPALHGQCPDLTGDYVSDDDTALQVLAMVANPFQPPPLRGVLGFSGDPLTALNLAVGTPREGAAPPVMARLENGPQMRCVEGWLETRRVDAPRVPQDGLQVTEMSLAFAPNAEGGLAVRKRTHTHRQIRFSVWCGDGCRYITIPLPLTARTRTEWLEWYRYDGRLTSYNEGRTAPGETPEQALRRILLKLGPAGTRIDSVEPQGASTLVHLTLPGGADVQGMEERLLESSLGARVVAVDRPLRGNPRLTLQVAGAGAPGTPAR